MADARPSDADLVQRCRQGDRGAFDELVDRYRGVTYALALQRLGDRDRAADVAQQALIDAYGGLHSLRAPERFGAWLRGIALHLCADGLAAVERAPETNGALPGDAIDPAPQAPLLVEREALRRRVRSAIAGLSRANRLAVQLCYFDGLSCREVADFCGVSTSAIKSRLHEARRAMRKGLTGMGASAQPQDDASEVPGAMTYSGDSGVGVLFWHRAGTRELYFALYPEVGRDDRAFWSRFEHIPHLPGHVRLWEYAGVIANEGDRIVGLVPVYTEDDHARFMAWHARVSQAIVERVRASEDGIGQLMGEFRGETTDGDNLRHIAVVGRLIAHGVTSLLADTFVGAAHDWGGLGPAYIQAMRGRIRAMTGGYSTNTSGSDRGDARLVAFQFADRHPGTQAYRDHGSETVVGLVADLCHEARDRAAVLRGLGDQGQPDSLIDELLEAQWLRERDGLLHSALPWLPWREDTEADRLRPLAERVIEPMADAAEELRVLAAQSTFARCRFADVANLVASIATGYVVENLRRSGFVAQYPMPIPPGWGAWLYAPET